MPLCILWWMCAITISAVSCWDQQGLQQLSSFHDFSTDGCLSVLPVETFVFFQGGLCLFFYHSLTTWTPITFFHLSKCFSGTSTHKSQTWTAHCWSQSCREPLHGSLISRLLGIFQLTKGIFVIFFLVTNVENYISLGAPVVLLWD